MNVGILHLSDIHIENAKDWICDKGEKIAKAVLGTWQPLDIIFIVVSGDVANKGRPDQYKVAHDFLVSIKNYIHHQQANVEVVFIVAPGNHDCDFPEDGDLKARIAFIDSVAKAPADIERGDSIYNGLLSGGA